MIALVTPQRSPLATDFDSVPSPPSSGERGDSVRHDRIYWALFPKAQGAGHSNRYQGRWPWYRYPENLSRPEGPSVPNGRPFRPSNRSGHPQPGPLALAIRTSGPSGLRRNRTPLIFSTKINTSTGAAAP